MSPAFAVNPPPDVRCDCGPALVCLHRAPAPTDPTENTSVVPATKPAAEPTNTEGNTNV